MNNRCPTVRACHDRAPGREAARLRRRKPMRTRLVELSASRGHGEAPGGGEGRVPSVSIRARRAPLPVAAWVIRAAWMTPVQVRAVLVARSGQHQPLDFARMYPAAPKRHRYRAASGVGMGGCHRQHRPEAHRVHRWRRGLGNDDVFVGNDRGGAGRAACRGTPSVQRTMTSAAPGAAAHRAAATAGRR
jgi:hypothetical protein